MYPFIMSQKIQIGIIGYGRFGKLVERQLKKQSLATKIVIVHSSKARNLAQLVDCDVVIPSVPISQFESVIKNISTTLKPGALVIDVCSVKTYPVAVMKKYLPPEVHIIASHPLFGPDSAKNGMDGLKIALWNVNSPKSLFARVKQYCKKIGLKVIEISPDEHDRAMAYPQTYTHLVGRIGQQIGLKKTKIDTKGFEQTLKIQKYVVNDTWQLFHDMQTYNAYAREMRLKVKKALNQIESQLKVG